MTIAVTEGVKISVETFYQPKYSNPLTSEYVFAYRITIENNNDFTVQLLRRHWYVIDAHSKRTEVEGEGVIGQQPVIEPRQSHQYISYCNLGTELGKMHGTYLMKRFIDGSEFSVRIPEFQMETPFKQN